MATNVQLEKAYFSLSPGGLRGPDMLYFEARRRGMKGVTLADCKKFLRGVPVYTRHKRARRKYARNPIYASQPGSPFQMDIMSIIWASEENDGYKYALIGTDTFSKFLAASPLKDRTPESVIQALDEFLLTLPFPVMRIYCDKEGAFISAKVAEWCKRRDIQMYTSVSDTKAAGAERAIRHVRNMLARYFDWTKTNRWVDYLPHMVDNYNEKPHSVTKIRPLDLAVDSRLYVEPRWIEAQKNRLPPIGSFVKVTINRSIMSKEAYETYSREVFKVIKHKTHMPIPTAEIADLHGEKIIGSFYKEDLQPVQYSKKDREIEKVIKVRKNGKESLVKYKGWPKKFNEWIHSDSIKSP